MVWAGGGRLWVGFSAAKPARGSEGGPSVARWRRDLSTGITCPLQGPCQEDECVRMRPAPELACPARMGGVIKPICFLGRPSQPNPFQAN